MTRRSISRRSFVAGSAIAMTAAAMRHPLTTEAQDTSSKHDFASLARTHDLPSLSSWGPYSKKFHGISHISDLSSGLLFDLCIFPILEGAPVQLPNVTDRCGVHPWQATPDLSYYVTRTELLWKDQVYCQHTYVDAEPNCRLLRIELVNNTPVAQRVTLHALSQLCFPPLHELTAQPIRRCAVTLPSSGLWIGALDYLDMHFAVPRPTDTLVTDGRWRGEERMHDTVGGSALGQNFGRDSGDTVMYRISIDRRMANASVVFRFRVEKNRVATFRCNGLLLQDLRLYGTGEFTTIVADAGSINPGQHMLHIVSTGGSAAAINGFAIVEQDEVAEVKFSERSWRPKPDLIAGPKQDILLKYADGNTCYGFTLGLPAEPPQFLPWRELDSTFGAHSGQNTQDRIFGRGKGGLGDPDSLFLHTSWPTIELSPSSRRTILGMVAHGTEQEIRSSLSTIGRESAAHDERWKLASAHAIQLEANPSGQPHLPGQQLLAATTMMNVVYPLRAQRQTIRHYSPGKTWDSLYTWDTGFVGLGLLELDVNAAIESLNAYLTPLGSQSAFIHHGTPLPTQIYLFSEIWNRIQSMSFLRAFYPRVRQYYMFLAGHFGSSTTRKHHNGLISTWDYFYNSGGWDDYPPQVYMHRNKLEAHTVPVVSSSHLIRCARLLRMAANQLGLHNDISIYDTDIQQLSDALNRDAWDATSGYFGYVTYNEIGDVSGILRTESGVNFNMGLDGISPLIAGVCNEAQQQAILDHLFSKDHLWSEVGITTVDKQAPYYDSNGYWNGSVWFAHQWFLFKSMLDLGRGDLAVRIAQTGVNTWSKATQENYDCMEHFSPNSPFGAGWCQFSSLSSPALAWFSALYKPGHVTPGFDTWILKYDYRPQANEVTLQLVTQDLSDQANVLVCLRPATKYEVWCDGNPGISTEILPGLLRVVLPPTTQTLRIRGLSSKP